MGIGNCPLEMEDICVSNQSKRTLQQTFYDVHRASPTIGHNIKDSDPSTSTCDASTHMSHSMLEYCDIGVLLNYAHSLCESQQRQYCYTLHLGAGNMCILTSVKWKKIIMEMVIYRIYRISLFLIMMKMIGECYAIDCWSSTFCRKKMPLSRYRKLLSLWQTSVSLMIYVSVESSSFALALSTLLFILAFLCRKRSDFHLTYVRALLSEFIAASFWRIKHVSRQSNAFLKYLWKIPLALIHNNLHLICRRVDVSQPILACKKSKKLLSKMVFCASNSHSVYEVSISSVDVDWNSCVAYVSSRMIRKSIALNVDQRF